MIRRAPFAARLERDLLWSLSLLWSVFLLMAPGVVAAVQATSPQPNQYSASTLYNLGNSYAREGKPGMAVLNYERARLLEPNDPDIRANLQHVRAAAGLPPETPSRFDRIARLANPLILAWAGLAGLIVAGLSTLACKAYPRQRLKLGAAALIGFSLCAVTVCNAIVMWPTLSGAVVVTPTAAVRVSPVPMGEPLTTLREAEIVSISAHHDSFILVQTRTGLRGWVSSENIAPVLPPGS